MHTIKEALSLPNQTQLKAGEGARSALASPSTGFPDTSSGYQVGGCDGEKLGGLV